MRPLFLRRAATSNPHPGVTTQPSSGSKGSSSLGFVVGVAFASVGFTGANAIDAALGHRWFEAGACAIYDVTVLAIWRLARQEADRRASQEAATDLVERLQRQRQAVARRDELIRDRAEAKRLHRPVKHIDRELVPLAAKIEAGAI